MRVEHMVRVMVISLDLFKDADIKGVLAKIGFNSLGTYQLVEL